MFFGFVGLLVFLLGALLWFIKRTDTASVIAVDAPGGCNVTISGRTKDQVAYFLKDLVEGTAVKNYQAA